MLSFENKAILAPMAGVSDYAFRTVCARLGAAVTVEVTLSQDDPPVPEYVEIFGEISPYIKLRLEELIQEELNIAKENQRWTG